METILQSRRDLHDFVDPDIFQYNYTSKYTLLDSTAGMARDATEPEGW
jgi:hypothetical protein